MPVLDSARAVAALGLAAVQVARQFDGDALVDSSKRSKDATEQERLLWKRITAADVPLTTTAKADLIEAIRRLDDLMDQGESVESHPERLRTFLGLAAVLHALRALLDNAAPQIAILPARLPPIRDAKNWTGNHIVVNLSDTIPKSLLDLQHEDLERLRTELPRAHARLAKRANWSRFRRYLGSFLVPHSRVDVLVPLPRLVRSIHVRCLPPPGATVTAKPMKHWLHVMPRAGEERVSFWTKAKFGRVEDHQCASIEVESLETERPDSKDNDSQSQLIFGNDALASWRMDVVQRLADAGAMAAPPLLEFNRFRYSFEVRGPLVYFLGAGIAAETIGVSLATFVYGYHWLDWSAFLTGVGTPLAVAALLVALRGTTGPWLGGKLVRCAFGWTMLAFVTGCAVGGLGRLLGCW